MAIEALKDEIQQFYCVISIATFISIPSSAAATVSTTTTTANEFQTTHYSFVKENNEIVSAFQNKHQILKRSNNHSINSKMETDDRVCCKTIIDSPKECDTITSFIYQLKE